MHQSVCVPAALLAVLLLTLVVPGGQSCPRSCNCYQADEVHCTFRSLLTIPPGLPSHTRRINLGFNSISRIPDSSLAGLKRAELLMLHSNDLHHLPDAVFKDMKSLQILKLSYNKLREISSSLTFSGLTSLLRLYLDHNLLQHIHPRALLQLPSLRLLRLQGNRLHQLHPHTLCTLSLLNTYYFSTLRHLDLSNNSLTTLPKDTLATAPQLETLVLQANPWSCDCRMNWLLSWNLAHPGLMKCPGGPQCPTCMSPNSLQGQGLLDQTDLPCTSPVIPLPGRNTSLETELSEIQSSETFREPVGSASVGLSDQQGNSVDLSCNITHSSDSQDIALPPDLSLSSSSPIPLALSLSLECPVERESYEKLWRILAYYSETAVRLEREIMLSKAPALAYRYSQAAETGGYYHTGVKASVKVKPQWLLQPAISIQLNRAQSNGHIVHLIYSAKVSAHAVPTYNPSTSSPASHPWVLVSTNHTITAIAVVSGIKVELPCPHLSSGNPKVQWILPDGSKLISPSSSLDGRVRASASGLLLDQVQLSDAGLYYCVAQAGRDSDALPLSLAVEDSSVPLAGEQLGPPVTVTVGEPVSLSCKASGSPAPYISWVLPDGNILRSGLAASGGLTIQPNGSLSLPNPSLSDAGHYRCIAVNRYGSDSLSMQLGIKTLHPPLLRTLIPSGPQSASGRSTKIRAPLLRQMEEGSGDEDEEEESTLAGNRKSTGPHQPLPNRRYPFGKPKRRWPVREGPPRRGGGLVSSTNQRRNRFDNRHRVTTNKQRIDPLKWADLLAKIRQKNTHTTNNQPITAAEPTAEPVESGKDRDTARDNGVVDRDRGRAEGAGVEAETEGSSVDETVLQEEGLQPIQTVLTQMQTHSETKSDTDIEKGRERSTETQTDTDKKTHIQTQNPGPQTETATTPETQQEPVTYTPISGSNEIVPEPAEGDDRGANPNPTRTRPQSPRKRLPNLVPNSRSQSPWNSRRRLGQQRRIKNRPRLQPFTPARPLPDPTHQRSQTATPDTTTDQSDMLLLVSSTTSPSTLLSRNDRIKTTPNGAALNSLSPLVSHTLGISTSQSASPSLTPSASLFTSLSPSHTNPRIDMMTHSASISDTAESTLFNTATPAPTHSDFVITQTHVPQTYARKLTHGVQTHTNTHTALSKHVDIPSSKHSDEQQRNLLGMPYESHSTTLSSTHSSIVSSSAAIATIAKTPLPTTLKSTNFTTLVGNTTSTSTITISEDTTTTPMITNPIMSTTTTIIIPKSSATRSMTKNPTSTTTTTLIHTSTTPTTTAIYSASPSTTNTTTAATSTKTSLKAFPSTPNHTTTSTATTSSPRMTTSVKTSPTTIRTPTSITSSTATTTMTSTSTRTSFRERPSIGRVDTQGRPVSGAQNQSRSPHDWKNPGANSIPDSHSSRPHWSPSLPAVPGHALHVHLLLFSFIISLFVVIICFLNVFSKAPVLRTRPRIRDPHIRTVSFPAESTARMACEAQGEPKPSITWTKVATGAVMSIHSKAQRFEVLPNGTLVIQNVQLQDRGTYICSAHSFLGRDRLLTTLEVWTRPPRMQLASYREATIHQGGEVLLECQADGVPTPLLSWVLPDRSVLTSAPPSASRVFMDTNGTLHIAATLTSDRGVYRCVASNSAGAASSSVRVHVSSLPPVIQQPREEHLLLSPGRPVYAHCSARGAPPPTLRWRIPDGTLVRPSQFLHGNLFVLPNGTLHIRSVGPKDSGSYECTASNAVGADKRTVSRTFKARIVSTSPSITTVHYGGILHLHCTVTGNPPPIIIWRTPNRKLVDMHFSYDRRLKVHPNGTLSAQAVTEKDAGDYLCIARNKVADDYRLLRVSVATKPAKIEPKQPPNQMVSFGKSLKVDCQASGLPNPAVHWSLPDGTMVNSVLLGEDRGGRARRLTVFDNGTLLVPAVGMGEEGEYTCYAENQGGQDIMKVKVKVTRTSPPTFADDKSYHVIKVRQGVTAKLRCQATGDPHPTVTWLSPAGRVIPRSLGSGYYSERVVVVSDGTLEVRLAQKIDTGNYTCRASNSGGERSMVVGLAVEAFNQVTSGQVGGRSTNSGPNNSRLGVNINNAKLFFCHARPRAPLPLVWPGFLPGNGVLPAPYYGSRLTVHRNGSLELRGVRATDAGTLVCVVKSERGETRIQLELEVSEPQEEARTPHRGTNVERPLQKIAGLVEAPQSGASLLSAQSSSSVLPERLHSRIPVTPKPLQRGLSLPAAPHPLGPPLRTGPVSEPAVSTRTASLVTIINGETLRLPCPAPQTPGYTQGSLSWTMPSGKVLSRGESGDSGRLFVQEDGTITVQQASVFDRGTYTCRSTSNDSSSISAVTVPVIVIAYPPRITTGPSPVTYTRPGVAVELPCLTIATPRATVTWETPDLTQLRVMGQARIYGNRYLSPQGSLVIQNPTSRDTGFYRCTAKNVIGVDTKATYLHVI
uniref:Ig-like domain-containing protein n=1 Tax=Scophthalmus maximus TaxID=52904 RepID=A0A8D3ABZ4_SCOMX